MSWKNCALLALILLGCTGDSTDDDTDNPIEGPNLEPLLGTVQVNTWEDGQGWVSADIRDQVAPDIWDVKAEENACVTLVRKEEGTCTNPCNGFCTPAGECLEEGERVSSGPITLGGLNKDIALEFTDGNYRPNPEPDTSEALYNKNATITAEAAGDVAPGFTLSATGVSVMETTLQGINLADVDEFTVTWTAENSGEIFFQLLLGHHLAPPSAAVLCLAKDDGSHTLPSALLTPLPDTEFYEPHNSFLSRQSTDRVDTDDGPIELRVSSSSAIGAFFNVSQ